MFQKVLVAGMISVAIGVTSYAADLNKAIADAVGRVRAAETGVREIKTKASQRVNDVQPLYTAALSTNNTWLDLVTQAVQRGDTSAPDVTAAAQSAASSLVEWVSARNRTIGLPDLTGTTADSVRTTVVQNLTDIATEFWKGNRRANDQRRAKAIADLNSRLRWKAWDEI